MFFNKSKQDSQCAFQDGQQKIAHLQADIWRLSREIRTLYETLNETQGICTVLMDRLASDSNVTRPKPR
ncbi:MAG: hypothetical protein HKM04_06165 [Legionellales bacterium]|nr:hypothetical protein [Legionellales bacterium]